MNPTAAPNDVERVHHYLWRFWNNVPKAGHIAIFDRTWYGRVLVEHIEGFCTMEQWGRAYDEINRFERRLADWGAIVLKFWLQIDQEEQLRRFIERQRIPEKQYKSPTRTGATGTSGTNTRKRSTRCSPAPTPAMRPGRSLNRTISGMGGSRR